MNLLERSTRDTSPSRGTSTVRNRLLALLVSLAVLVVAAIGFAGTASAAPPAPPVTKNVTGTVNGTAVTGVLEIQRFVAQGGTLQAVGTLGDLTDATDPENVLAEAQQVTLPVTSLQATCEILDLVLGPLDLDLLGLVVHLDEVHLNITAESGPGNLLGNLLCAIAGLLNGPTGGPLGAIAALLNRILTILG